MGVLFSFMDGISFTSYNWYILKIKENYMFKDHYDKFMSDYKEHPTENSYVC